ncbi:MAG: hypothetical protein H0T42_13615 [Deltaproteobacteria bacterium]|nr:hypothetical protein [Deltaproteobacteria bacterium]
MTPKRRRLLALVLVWTLPSVLFLTTTAVVYALYRIEPPVRLGDADRTAVIASLRAAVDDLPAIPCTVPAPLDETLVATVWSKGRAVVRIDGHGKNLGSATDDASIKLRTSAVVRALSSADRESARIQVDVITGTAPLGGVEPYAVPGIAEMLAINPGVEGIGTDVTGTRTVILPNELVAARVLAAKRPSNSMPDFAMGIDMKRITAMLMTRAKIGIVRRSQLFRFRTDTFVEQPLAHRAFAPVQLYRGIPVPPPLSARTLRDAALAGGRFLVSHLAPNGRYIYEHELSTGQQTDPMRQGAYSMPRHAGTTYFLAELYRITKEEWLREPIERAFKHLAELLKTGKCGSTLPDGTEIDCVLDRTEKIAHLGSTALTVVALAEYQRATGDTTYLPMAQKFTAWILWMQRADGSFRHLYDPVTRKASEDELLYYSGEAALALARMHVITGDARYATAAEKALDWLVHWYDFFMGGFFYGEEHWTCIAAEAAWPASKNPEYKDFCHGYGRFLREQQPAVGEHPDQDDYAGAYNFTSFVPPYNTPAGSRTEAMISSYLLGRHHGAPDARVRDQIRAALQYALGQQIRTESDFNVVGDGLGGMPGSPIDRNVRIDFVQHVCSAMIRASEWIDGP